MERQLRTHRDTLETGSSSNVANSVGRGGPLKNEMVLNETVLPRTGNHFKRKMKPINLQLPAATISWQRHFHEVQAALLRMCFWNMPRPQSPRSVTHPTIPGPPSGTSLFAVAVIKV